MRSIITYSFLPVAILLLLSLRAKEEMPNKILPDFIKYYIAEHSCLTVNKRCDLEIVKLINMDTIVYVSSSEHSRKYEEVWGKLTKINDSIFYVKSFRVIQQQETMPYYGKSKDTLTFHCDSSLIGLPFKIEYFNKKTELHRIYSTTNRFPIDKKLFNSRSEFVIVSFDYPHPIVKETVELKVGYYSDIHFKSYNFKNDFYIIYTPSIITTLNIHSHSEFTFGPKFTLRQMTSTDKFNRGRTLR
jgi:hypothetical protein